jgi:hypothetical protein
VKEGERYMRGDNMRRGFKDKVTGYNDKVEEGRRGYIKGRV